MPWKVKPATSQVSGKNQLRRGKPRVRIACVMMMLMMCCRVVAAGVVVDDEETEELPPISRRRMSCRVHFYAPTPHAIVGEATDNC